MNKEFVPYTESLALKELGFDEPCFAYYENNNLTVIFPSKSLNGWKWVGNSIIPAKNINAPTYSQAFRWFREKYDLFGCIDLQACTPSHWFIRVDKIEINDYLYHSEDENLRFSTYEEAELACLKKLIEIIKNK